MSTARADWDCPCRRGTGIAAVTIVGLLILGLGLSAGSAAGATAPVQFSHNESSDATPPTFEGASRLNDTAVTVEFADNHDIDESTIGTEDFDLSDGNLTAVSTAENGSNATATLVLAERIDVDEINVAIADDADIADTNDNIIDTSEVVSETVDGMDGIDPRVIGFSVTDATGGPAELTLSVTEALAGVNVSIKGPGIDRLGIEAFSQTQPYDYVATYRPPSSGTYIVTLENLTDTGGNTHENGGRRGLVADLDPPTTVASLDLAGSEGLTFAFDGGRSSDPSGVANYTWSFGDGTSATGQRVTHTFSPGNYTVTLRATDAHGNVGTDTLILNLSDGVDPEALNTSEGATISRFGASATVSVTRARPGRTVRTGGAPLASRGALTLEGMVVNVTRNASIDMSVAATDAGSVADLRSDRIRPLAGLRVIHGIPESALANVTFRFRIAPEKLDAVGASPSDVSLYRFHGGSWTELPTSRAEKEGSFRARSPGLSRFAIAVSLPEDGSKSPIAGTPTSTPTPEATTTATQTSTGPTVTGVTLNRTAVAVNGTVSVNATVANQGSTTGQFTAGLSVNGTLVETRTVRVADGATEQVRFVYRPPRAGTYTIAINGTDGGTVTVSTVTATSGILGILPLGVLPLGLLRPLVLFVGLPVLVVYLALKGLALYLGY